MSRLLQYFAAEGATCPKPEEPRAARGPKPEARNLKPTTLSFKPSDPQEFTDPECSQVFALRDDGDRTSGGAGGGPIPRKNEAPGR